MAYFKTENNSDIYYRRCGKLGAQPLVFIHGFTCDSADWDAQVSYFEKPDRDFDVVALDLGAHGKSSSKIEYCSMEQYADDVLALIEALELKNVFLIGHSMGCRVAICAAGKEQSKLAGLALLDSGAAIKADELEDVLQGVADVTAQIGHPALMKNIFENMFFDDFDSKLKSRIIEKAVAFDSDVAHHVGTGLMKWEAAELDKILEGLKVPICGIVSTKVETDFKRSPVKVGEYEGWAQMMLEKTPQIQITNIPETGHFVMQERPDQVNNILREFFEASL